MCLWVLDILGFFVHAAKRPPWQETFIPSHTASNHFGNIYSCCIKGLCLKRIGLTVPLCTILLLVFPSNAMRCASNYLPKLGGKPWNKKKTCSLGFIWVRLQFHRGGCEVAAHEIFICLQHKKSINLGLGQLQAKQLTHMKSAGCKSGRDFEI